MYTLDKIEHQKNTRVKIERLKNELPNFVKNKRLIQAPRCEQPIPHSNPNFVGFFSAFGTILFAFGGASCFPNIQVDMKDPDKFPISVVLGIMSEFYSIKKVLLSLFLCLSLFFPF